MKAYVYVSLKKTVLDPQGKTIQGALKKMGYQGLGDVRQGKFFEIALNGGLTKEQAHAEVEKMAADALASGSPNNNPRVPTAGEIVSLYRQAW